MDLPAIEPLIFSGSRESFRCPAQVGTAAEAGLTRYRVSGQVPAGTAVDRVRLFELPLSGPVTVFRQGFYMPSDPAGFYRLAAGEAVPYHGYWNYGAKGPFEFMSHSLVVLDTGAAEKLLVGFTSFRRFDGYFLLDTSGPAITLSAWNACEGLVPGAGGLDFEEFLVLRGRDLPTMLGRYAAIIARENRARVPKETVTGWVDWQFYREEKDEQCVLASLESLTRLRRQGYPFKYVIVDGGWCDHASEWLRPSRKFASGMAKLSATVRATGCELGLWFAPYLTNVQTSVVQEHPEFLMRRRDSGELLHKPGSNVGPCHMLDFTVPGALDWLRGIVRTLVRDWQVGYLKLDGPCLGHYQGGRLHDPSATTISMVRQSLQVIREECGEEVIVEGEGIYGPSIGFVDVQRVSQDYFPFWYHPDTGAPSLGGNLRKELASTFLHGTCWHNHRENLALRDFLSPFHARGLSKPGTKDSMLPEREIETELTAATLAGGAMLLSDPMQEFARSRSCLALIAKCLPHFPLHSRPLDACTGGSDQNCYVATITRDFEEWQVLGVFNWSDGYQDFQVPLDAALAGEWHAFEFWNEEYLGLCSGSLALRDVPAHGCRLIALRRKADRPQLIGTNMHLLQGAVDLESVTYGEDELRLRVGHFVQKDAAVFVWLPGCHRLSSVETSAAAFTVDARAGQVVKILFDGTGSTDIRLRWQAHDA